MKQYDHTGHQEITQWRANKRYCYPYCELDPDQYLVVPTKTDWFSVNIKKNVAKFLFLIYKAAFCLNLMFGDFHETGFNGSPTKFK